MSLAETLFHQVCNLQNPVIREDVFTFLANPESNVIRENREGRLISTIAGMKSEMFYYLLKSMRRLGIAPDTEDLDLHLHTCEEIIREYHGTKREES